MSGVVQNDISDGEASGPAAAVLESAAGDLPDARGRRVGVIAGSGRVPFLVAEGIRRAGGRACAIGLKGSVAAELPAHCDDFRYVGVARIGQWIRTLRKWGVEQAVMVGAVEHTKKYARFQALRYIPDWRAAVIWYRHLRHDRRTSTMLTTLADELARSGVTLIDNRAYIPDHLAFSGVMTETTPSQAAMRDIEFGWAIIKQAVELHFGQSMAVRSCDIVAVEAAEGTNTMIERAGSLTKGRDWVLLKTSSRGHDMRADVPTIGVETVERVHAAGGAAIALGAGRVIMVDRPDVLKRADELRVAIVGMHAGEDIEATRHEEGIEATRHQGIEQSEAEEPHHGGTEGAEKS